MIRTAAVPRPIRIGAAAVGVAGALALAGCAASDTDDRDRDRRHANGHRASATPDPSAPSPPRRRRSSTYADGTYTAEGSYATPESVETISGHRHPRGRHHHGRRGRRRPAEAASPSSTRAQFIGGIADVVVGQDIDQISVSRVAGSSLTSGGFNQAIDDDQVRSDGLTERVAAPTGSLAAAVWRFDAIGTAWQIETTAPLGRRRSRRGRGRDRRRSTANGRGSDPTRSSPRSRGGAAPSPAPPDAAAMLDAFVALDRATAGAVNPLVGRVARARGYDAAYAFVDRGARPAPAGLAERLTWTRERALARPSPR